MCRDHTLCTPTGVCIIYCIADNFKESNFHGFGQYRFLQGKVPWIDVFTNVKFAGVTFL